MLGKYAIFVVGFVVLTSSAGAKTWNVLVDGSGDAPSVQAGIDSAAAGDTVLVHPGTYFEKIVFRGRDIVLRSLAGPNQTILDAAGLGGRVVRIASGEGRATILEGFTITHGAGGMIIIGAQPTIIGNIITENDALPGDGGGIWCSAINVPWRPFFKHNIIMNNRGRNLAGGIGFGQQMIPEIIDNYIAGNEARDGDGGGIYYRSFDNGAVIRGNVVINNRAGDHGGGIYAALVNSPPPALQIEISWNLVANNVAPGSAITGVSGGGIHLIETDAWVHHNTIVGNEGGGTPNTLGGGIGVERIGSPLIEQNIIANTIQGGGVNCVGGATPIFRNNFAWQNVGGDGVGTCASWWQANGNVIDNPYFCDMANGDYTVASNSGVMTHPAGPLGVYAIPGCAAVSVQRSTWGMLKSRY